MESQSKARENTAEFEKTMEIASLSFDANNFAVRASDELIKALKFDEQLKEYLQNSYNGSALENNSWKAELAEKEKRLDRREEELNRQQERLEQVICRLQKLIADERAEISREN